MPTRILLIEDNPANLELMTYLLQAFGYTVRFAMDGGMGLKVARSEPFDLIICDIQMPVLDGFEIARHLKRDLELQSTPLVAITALAMVGDRERILKSGFNGYIAKPIDPEMFVNQVESYLRPESRISFVLPSAITTNAKPHLPTNHRTILVVDNLASNLELAKSILEPHGYGVITAESMAAGLEAARRNCIDLILSDVCMHRGTGYDFIRAVKADPELAKVPFIFLTSTMLGARDKELGLSLGAARYLFRPIEPDALLAEIDTCLSKVGKAT